MNDWAAQFATIIGATIGIAATVIVDRLRSRREDRLEWRTVRREVYAQFLAGLAEAHGAIRAASYIPPEDMDTDTAVQEAYRESQIFEARHQVALIAPAQVARTADAAFHAMSDIRNTLREGNGIRSEQYNEAVAAYRVKLLALRDQMRIDLGVEPLHDQPDSEGRKAAY